MPAGAGAHTEIQNAHVPRQNHQDLPDSVLGHAQRVEDERRQEEHDNEIGPVADPVGDKITCDDACFSHYIEYKPSSGDPALLEHRESSHSENSGNVQTVQIHDSDMQSNTTLGKI